MGEPCKGKNKSKEQRGPHCLQDTSRKPLGPWVSWWGGGGEGEENNEGHLDGHLQESIRDLGFSHEPLNFRQTGCL